MTHEELAMLGTSRIGRRALAVVDGRIMPMTIDNLEEFSALKSRLIHLYVTGTIDQETYDKLNSISSIKAL